VINLKCDKEIDEARPDLVVTDTEKSGKLFTISFSHKNACGYDAIGYLEGLGWFQYVFESILMLAGLFVCFFGLKMWKPSLGIMGFLIGYCVSYILMSIFWTSFDATWKSWTMLAISVVLGILCAVLICMCEKFSTFALAGFLGYTVFEMVWTTFISLHVNDG